MNRLTVLGSSKLLLFTTIMSFNVFGQGASAGFADEINWITDDTERGEAVKDVSVMEKNWPTHTVALITDERGTYLLDFDKIYETVASLDIETMVTLPKGYTFSLNRQGSVGYINAFIIQNTLFFTRTIDHAISTSLTCNVVTPSGETKNLVFKIRGGPDYKNKIVYAIHFEVEEVPVAKPVVSQKSCDPEIEAALAHQGRELNNSVYLSTMTNALPAFFNAHRGSMKKEYKGATAYINGIIFTRGEAFVYLYADVRKDQCDIIKLLKIKQGKNELMVDLVDVFENLDGTWSYVYRTGLQPPKRNKRTKIQFILEIWSKSFIYNAIIS